MLISCDLLSYQIVGKVCTCCLYYYYYYYYYYCDTKQNKYKTERPRFHTSNGIRTYELLKREIASSLYSNA